MSVTVEEAISMKSKLEKDIFHLVAEYEEITGIIVEDVVLRHRTSIGHSAATSSVHLNAQLPE